MGFLIERKYCPIHKIEMNLVDDEWVCRLCFAAEYDFDNRP